MPVERFKLAARTRLIDNRVARVQLFFDSAKLGAGESRECPATKCFGDAKRRNNGLDVGISELPRSLSLSKQAGSC